jgi:hypothetical protein
LVPACIVVTKCSQPVHAQLAHVASFRLMHCSKQRLFYPYRVDAGYRAAAHQSSSFALLEHVC